MGCNFSGTGSVRASFDFDVHCPCPVRYTDVWKSQDCTFTFNRTGLLEAYPQGHRAIRCGAGSSDEHCREGCSWISSSHLSRTKCQPAAQTWHPAFEFVYAFNIDDMKATYCSFRRWGGPDRRVILFIPPPRVENLSTLRVPCLRICGWMSPNAAQIQRGWWCRESVTVAVGVEEDDR